MAERTLTNEDVKGAIKLYNSLPAATFFRGLTGYGLISEDGVEKVGQISSSAGIWKPTYFFIIGGQKKGRRTLKSEDVKTAVEQFQENELWALLRVTTGQGIKLDAGTPSLADIKEAQAGINFELTHFGGRSIVPRLEVELSELQDTNIKWQSGFLYQSWGDKALARSKNLMLTRVLAEQEFGSDDHFDRVWQDVDKEVKRLLFFHCDSNSLPRSSNDSGDDRIRVFLSQELTKQLPNVQIDRKPGFEYSVRNDGTVVVQRSVRRHNSATEDSFAKFMEEFVAECYRVYFSYCEQLTDAQKDKLGRPVSDTNGLVEAEEGEFERDTRRSTETEESLITWIGRRPGFPYEGWSPEKGKKYFFFQHAWGKGYRVSPGAPRYEERITEKDKKTASRQMVKIEYDGDEKIVKEEDISLGTEDRPETGCWSNELTTFNLSNATIRQTREVWIGIYKQIVKEHYSDPNTIEWERQKKKRDKKESRELQTAVEKIWAKSNRGYEESVKNLELSSYKWTISVKGQDSDGDEYSHDFYFEWEKLPQEVQQEVEGRFPVCKCGKYRFNKSQNAECEHCRIYGTCSYCGEGDTYMGDWKSQEKICADCKSGKEFAEKAKQAQGKNWNRLIKTAQEIVSGKISKDEYEREQVELASGVYRLYFPSAITSKIAVLESMTPKEQASVLKEILPKDSWGDTNFSKEIVLTVFARESETSLEALEPELEKLREQWDQTPSEGNPEGEVTGKAWFHTKQAKEFLLAEYGSPYNRLGNSASRHTKLAWASAILAGNWEAITSRPISAISWLKEYWSYGVPADILEAFRATPDFESDIKSLGSNLDERRLSQLVSKERQRFEEQRLEDFWTMLSSIEESNPEPDTESLGTEQIETSIEQEPEADVSATEAVASTSNGYWTPTADPQMAKKGWFLCPNGHSEKKKKAQSGDTFECSICQRSYSVE